MSCFQFIPLEFEYQALAHVHLPEGKTTNILRGALGLELRRQSCHADCVDSKSCPFPRPCLYQQLFEGETGAPRPSGFQEPPRPFVLRSPVWEERTLAPGQRLVTSLNLFDQRPEILRALLIAYSQMGSAGLGPGRAQLSLREIRQSGDRILWSSHEGGRVQPPAAMVFNFDAVQAAPTRVIAEFLTPTELKVQGEITRDASFEMLFARLQERIRFLMKHYAGGACSNTESDLARDAAKQITTLRQDLHGVGGSRYSTRTGQSHPLAGFVGRAEYAGDFTLLWPWLKASQETGVGRQTVWGKGTIRWTAA